MRAFTARVIFFLMNTNEVVAVLSSVVPAGVTVSSKANKFGGIDFVAEGNVLVDVQDARLAMLGAVKGAGLKGNQISMRRANGNTAKQYVWAIGQYERHGMTGYLTGELYRTGLDLRNVDPG